MALYRLEHKVHSRSRGRNAVAAAAYRSGSALHEHSEDVFKDFERRAQGVAAAWIDAPEATPSWAFDRETLWNGVEAAEKRKDAQVARELVLALPHELNEQQREALVERFVREEVVAEGMVADVAIHTPDPQGDPRNVHAHVLMPFRRAEADGFGKKERAWNQKGLHNRWRENWEAHCNAALEAAEITERVDHRDRHTIAESRGVEPAPPEPKVGPSATALERKGVRTRLGDARRDTQRERENVEASRRLEQIADEERINRYRELPAQRALDREWSKDPNDVLPASRAAVLEQEANALYNDIQRAMALRDTADPEEAAPQAWARMQEIERELDPNRQADDVEQAAGEQIEDQEPEDDGMAPG